MRITHVLPALAAATLSLGLMAGCGQQTASTDVRSVAELTDDSFASTIASAVADAGSAHVAAEGTVMGMPVQLEGDIAGGGAAKDLALALASPDGGIDIRLVDQVVYAKADPFTGGQFLSVDLTDADDPLVQQMESFKDTVDVQGLLADLDGAISVEATGDEPQTLDGVETTAYAVTVDTAELSPSSESARVPRTIELTVLVGTDDLPRRIVMDAPGTPVTIDFSAWGEPVDVDAPAADQISEQSASDLLGGFLGTK